MPQNRMYGFEAQARSQVIVFAIATTLLLLLAGTMQTALFSRFTLFGAVPDLMICIVLCVSYFNGRYVGAITGIAAGFFIEAIGARGIMVLPLVYMVMGYLVGNYARAVQPKRYVPYLFYLACALGVRAGVTVLYSCLHYKVINVPQILLRAVLPELLVTAIAGVLLYFPMKLFCKKIKA